MPSSFATLRGNAIVFRPDSYDRRGGRDISFQSRSCKAKRTLLVARYSPPRPARLPLMAPAINARFLSESMRLSRSGSATVSEVGRSRDEINFPAVLVGECGIHCVRNGSRSGRCSDLLRRAELGGESSVYRHIAAGSDRETCPNPQIGRARSRSRRRRLRSGVGFFRHGMGNRRGFGGDSGRYSGVR